MSMTTFLRPRLSEKTYGLGITKNVYVFDVPADVNKHTVASAVTAQFKVTVLKVNIVNQTGKAKRTVRKGGRAVAGQRSDIKKAYVTLKVGDKLPFFDEPEEDKKAGKKAATKETK
ncbi:MAG TPA: 50S ribosomal protein L23 [Patescibacteria group bacterium]|nr:50S ribosomal protein L23 [Patescibacteria group bacterium]